MVKTHALLLTDVVDSTKLSEALGDERMATLWAAHDRVGRDLLKEHEGREIDKTDGFLLLFDEVGRAVDYAIAYHAAIAALDPPLQARAGVHLGRVILTENRPEDVARGAKPLEVDGLAKPVAARVMSVAGGGQTLLTAVACAALDDTRFRTKSHGHWRMKGVAEPIELFEVGQADTPFTPPPDGAKVYRVVWAGDLWLPRKQVEHSLPRERNAFVGRVRDLQALSERLDDGASLVSILGIGGTGKTRLALRYAWSWLGDYPGGVWFCDLSEARRVDGIVDAVARSFGVPLGDEDPVARLGHAIAGRGRCLMLLDNFEQVARHAEDTLGHWLDMATEARFVVTTREVLGLPGEVVLALSPLPRQDAAALFTARAKAAWRDFSPDDSESIDALVALLDRLPLAIELAAARVRVLPPKILLSRMSQRFRLLTSSGGRRDRQATLRATLDWSWDLLTADEQAALAQLSVFEGGFTLQASEEVLALDEAWPMDAVQALVDKSLVRAEDDGRFDLLVSVQEYAAEKLREFGGQTAAEVRHAEFFADLGTHEAIQRLWGHGGNEFRQALGRELDNVVTGCNRATELGRADIALRLLAAASEVLDLRGPVAMQVALAVRVFEMARLSPAQRATAVALLASSLVTVGRLAEASDHYQAALTESRRSGNVHLEARSLLGIARVFSLQSRSEAASSHFKNALALYQQAGDRQQEGVVLQLLASTQSILGQVDVALASYHQALAACREVGDRRSEGHVLLGIGALNIGLGRMDDTRAPLVTALEIAREVGDRDSESMTLGNLAVLEEWQGRSDEALKAHERVLAISREMGVPLQTGATHANLGLFHSKHDRPDAAHQHYDAALAAYRRAGDRRGEAIVQGNQAHLFQTQGRLEEASQQYEAALTAHRELENWLFAGNVLTNLARLDLDQGRLEQARDRLIEAEARIRPIGHPVALGLLLCARALLEHAEGHTGIARATLAELDAMLEETGFTKDTGVASAELKAREVINGL